ncbi:MAG: hypothetical protein PF508_00585 [Spirochaeta sp.]|jgi:hypothetical protein|nr:hypothetical protein [Spirochaeta sp.]
MISPLQPDTLSAGELLRRMRTDRTFDFFHRPDIHPAPDYLYLRPAVLLNDQVVWGFHYEDVLNLEADVEADADSGPAQVVPVLRITHADPSPADENAVQVVAVRYALDGEGRAGTYRWTEINRIVSHLERVLAPDVEGYPVPAAIRSAIDPARDLLELLRRYRRLAEPLRAALDAGDIDIRTAEIVPDGLIPTVPALLEALQTLSFSDRRQILRLAAGLWRRGDVDVDDILATMELRERNGILDRLRRLRYPVVTDIETAMGRFHDRYTRGTGVEVAFPRNYEGEFLNVSFRIRSRAELERRLAALERMKEEVDDLVGLLF